VVKSLVSALTGIALDEGLIRSVDQPVTDFLSGFRYQGFDRVTIRHLLEMRSGIRFTESYFNPFSDVARYYYGASLDKLVYNARIKEPPGKRYDYASVNAQILGMILEKVSGKYLSQYLEDKIWSRIGMEYEASWNVDSRKNGRIRAFCCLNAAPADMARFARLYLRNGEWGSEQIISQEWIRESIRIANDSRDDQGYPYHHFWRVLEDGSYFAKGMLGQYIYIDPSRKLIICRFGKQEGDIDWVRFFRELSAGL
jgi:CubicO group peptidase (beta-lactamase class C family)